MANTYVLIASSTVGSGGAANIEFTSIPSTYTDLLVKVSSRMASGSSEILVRFNGSTSSHSGIRLQGTGSSVNSATNFTAAGVYINEEVYATHTADTFSNLELYVSNYAGSANKSFSSDGVTENNATQAFAQLTAGLWSNSAAITSITFYHSSGNFAQYSSAYLYGIKNS
jgi:hypothetical protein